MKNKKQIGRATETLGEINKLIEQLKLAQSKIESRGRTPPVDLSSAINHARHVKDLIDQIPHERSRLLNLKECVSYLVRLAKEIHSMINCYFTQKLHHEDWANHKAA